MLSVITLLAPLAAASPYTHTVTLLGGPSALVGPPSYGGGAEGRIWLAGERGAFEVGARELYATEEARMIGAILVGARVPFGEGPLYWRAAFAHNHEIPIEAAREYPLASALGTAEAITHRSGGELGLAWSSAVDPDFLAGGALEDRLGINADLALAGLTGEGGFSAYLYAGLMLSVGLDVPGD